jgi:uncharacterized protein YjbJ (UPF0337 family)
MNQDQIEGRWHQIKGQVKERWGRISNDDLDIIEGRAERLAGKIQERYGVARQEAERQIDEFVDRTLR